MYGTPGAGAEPPPACLGVGLGAAEGLRWGVPGAPHPAWQQRLCPSLCRGHLCSVCYPVTPPPLHTNKYLPTAPRSPCFLQRLLAHPQGPVLVGCFSWLPRGWLGVPLLGRAPPNAEGDCESPVAYQEEIYLKSDNHVGHLVKSSAVPAASCSRWELVECETKRGEAGLARQHPQRPAPDPAAGRWRRMQLRQRSGSCHGAEKCPRYVPAPGAEMQSQARVAPSQDARLEKIQKPKKKQTKSL